MDVMPLLVGHSVPTYFESLPDLAMLLLVLAATFLLIRYASFVCAASLRGERDVRTILKMYAVSAFVGFCGLARFALLFREWQDLTAEYGSYFEISWYPVARLASGSVYAAVFIAGLGFALAFLAANAKDISESRLSRMIIRHRVAIVAAVVAVTIATYWYRNSLRPSWNERSLVEKFESAEALDAYLHPKEVLLYSVLHDHRLPPAPPPLVDEEAAVTDAERVEWNRISGRYRGYRIARDVEQLDPAEAKRVLSDIFVYKSVERNGYANSQFMLRFVGETSVLDLWFSDYHEIEIYANKELSDLPYIKSFLKPYDEIMFPVVGEGLKYLSEEDYWLRDRFARLAGEEHPVRRERSYGAWW